MLRIIQTQSVAAAKSYYTQGLSREDAGRDYYSEGQECVGKWGGLGAIKLALEGDVTADAFDALCENRHPVTGERLTPRSKSNRTVLYDFNFHVPKSVSMIHALTGDEQIVTDFRQSVAETMRELEEDARTRVRRNGTNAERKTGNLVWGEFVHFTARPVEGVPDCHLHAHVVVMNQTYDDVEKRWKAVQFREIKRDAPYYESVLHARFAERLAERGYGITRTENGWEISGIPDSAIRKFSRRTQLIEAEAEKRGLTTDQQKDGLGAKTRESKNKSLTKSELQAEWAGRLSAEEAQAIRGAWQPSRMLVPPPVSSRDALQHAASHHFERASVTSERELLGTALKHGVGSVNVEQVKKDAKRSSLIRRERDERVLVTHESVVQEERELLAYAREGRGKHRPLVKLGQEIEQKQLSAEQQEAVRHCWHSPDAVIAIRGAAGVGKTTLMREAITGIQREGYHVFTFAPSAEASRGVLRKEGFDKADTVAKLLKDNQLQQAIEGQVIWIDEAGILSARSAHKVFELAKSKNARVILSGDKYQHVSVERGDFLHLLEDHAGIVPAEIKTIRRQQGEYREAVSALSQGRVGEGFDRLDRLGFIRELPDETRYATLAADYVAAVKTGKEVLCVSPTHHEGEEVTRVIRAELKNTGRLGKDEHAVGRLKNRQLTEAQRQDAVNYREGQVVQFMQNVKGVKRGERLTVASVGNDTVWLEQRGKLLLLPTQSASAFQVYEREELNFAAGDRVRITQNGMTKDKKHRLNNGAIYSVKEVTRSGDVKLNNGWVVDRDFSHWAHGYATTSHSSQGKTVDCVFVAQSSTSLAASTREQFYVSASRARQNVTVYTDDKQALREAVHDSSRRMSATELLANDQQAESPETKKLAAENERRMIIQKQLDNVRRYKDHMDHHRPVRAASMSRQPKTFAEKYGRSAIKQEHVRD